MDNKLNVWNDGENNLLIPEKDHDYSLGTSKDVARSLTSVFEVLGIQFQNDYSKWERDLISNGMTKEEVEKFKELWFKIDEIRRKQWLAEYDRQVGQYAKDNGGHATGFKPSNDLRKERPQLLDI